MVQYTLSSPVVQTLTPGEHHHQEERVQTHYRWWPHIAYAQTSTTWTILWQLQIFLSEFPTSVTIHYAQWCRMLRLSPVGQESPHHAYKQPVEYHWKCEQHAVSVEWCLRYADCLSLKWSFASRWLASWLATHLSVVLERNDKFDTGR